jgi:hypothetical protein
MLIPSISVLAVASILAAALMATDWYVWSFTYASDFRKPGRVRPYGFADLVNLALARIIGANEAVLPRSVIETAHEKAQVRESDPDSGFKRVA